MIKIGAITLPEFSLTAVEREPFNRDHNLTMFSDRFE